MSDAIPAVTSIYLVIFLMIPRPPISTLFPYTTLFRSAWAWAAARLPASRLQRTSNSAPRRRSAARRRSEEHTSELQSRLHLVCRLLLEKKRTITVTRITTPTHYINLTVQYTQSLHAPT